MAKAPQRNPFGEEDEPNKFVDFDIFLKLKVLVQLSQWTFMNPDRMRERMPEVKENEQTLWVGAAASTEMISTDVLCHVAYRRDRVG